MSKENAQERPRVRLQDWKGLGTCWATAARVPASPLLRVGPAGRSRCWFVTQWFSGLVSAFTSVPLPVPPPPEHRRLHRFDAQGPGLPDDR